VSAVAQSGPPAGEPRHGVRIFAIWLVCTVVMVPVMIWVIGPHIPPFHMSQQSNEQHGINVTLLTLATPIVLMLWVYFGYAIAVFRQDGGEAVLDGPPIVGDARTQLTWLLVTTVIVLGLATFGTISLLGGNNAGAGGGEGPSPLAKPSAAEMANALQVQVIGQQWMWTFRYPQYGGVETPTLVIPVNREVVFNVTSLDVVHSFWAVELGIKADAVPGANNIAYGMALKLGGFQVRCAELCGLFHGHMNSEGQVESGAGFAQWIANAERLYAPVTKQLPPYAPVYYPAPLRRAT
jgi:cytochrome c oxidase subunit II